MKDRPLPTPRQQQILEVVSAAIELTGAPPTRAEIAERVGYRSPNAADEQLRAMERKGLVEIVNGASRGIRLKAPASTGSTGSGADGAPMPTASSDAGRITLPVIGAIAKGQPLLAPQHVERMFRVAANLFQRRPDYLLRVFDMGMRDAGIVKGDLLAVQQASQADDGQIVVARHRRHGVLVRRLWRTSAAYALVPDNPEFAHVGIAPDEPGFSIEGLVVGLVRTGFGP